MKIPVTFKNSPFYSLMTQEKGVHQSLCGEMYGNTLVAAYFHRIRDSTSLSWEGGIKGNLGSSLHPNNDTVKIQ